MAIDYDTWKLGLGRADDYCPSRSEWEAFAARRRAAATALVEELRVLIELVEAAGDGDESAQGELEALRRRSDNVIEISLGRELLESEP